MQVESSFEHRLTPEPCTSDHYTVCVQEKHKEKNVTKIFTKKPTTVFKYFIVKAAHADELRKILVFFIPGLKMVSPGLIAVFQKPLNGTVSKCLAYYKGMSEMLVQIEQKSKSR